MNRPIRQGDIMLFPIKEISEGLTAFPFSNRLVLARGSNSNHEHMLTPAENATAYINEAGEIAELHIAHDCTLKIDGPVERHYPLTVVSGCYRLIHQTVEINHKSLRVED